MTEEAKTPVTLPELNKRILFTPHTIALIITWLLTTVSLVLMLVGGVRNTGQFRFERNFLQVAYVLVLFWYLIRTGPPIEELPYSSPLVQPEPRLRRLIPVIVITLLFLAELSGQGKGIVELLLMPAAVLVLIIWRREIGFPVILLGLGVATIAFLGGLPFYQNQAFGQVAFIVFLVFVIPMFVAGGLLSKRTGLRGSQLYAGRYKKAMASFLWGCLLFVPLGLTNATAGSPGFPMIWVNRWWFPLSQPWFSGIVEEAWWRLFTVSLCYFLLRPAFRKRPAIPLVCAMLFSAIIFGLGHAGTFQERFLMTGLLYGLPLAVTFARRDWEHAVGAHYMINMIPTLMVFLEN
jgi:hypothetical protein